MGVATLQVLIVSRFIMLLFTLFSTLSLSNAEMDHICPLVLEGTAFLQCFDFLCI